MLLLKHYFAQSRNVVRKYFTTLKTTSSVPRLCGADPWHITTSPNVAHRKTLPLTDSNTNSPLCSESPMVPDLQPSGAVGLVMSCTRTSPASHSLPSTYSECATTSKTPNRLPSKASQLWKPSTIASECQPAYPNS